MKFRDILVVAVVALLVPLIVHSEYHMFVLTNAAVYSAVIISLNIAFGLCGVFSLGHAAFWGIGAYTAANFLTRLQMPWVISLLAGGIVSALAGILLGIPSLKVRSFYLAVTTSGFNVIVNLCFVNWIALTYGSDGFPNIPPPFIGPYSIASTNGKYIVSIIVLLLLIWLFARIKNSRIGRAFQAIKDNELAADVSGINIHYYRVLAFAMSAFVGGVAGGLYASIQGYIAPDTFTGAQSTLLISMLLVGGYGSIWGPVLGSFFLQILSESMRFLADYYMVVYSLIVVIMALRFPGGLDALIRLVAGRLRSAWSERSCRTLPEKGV
jgi:branched-chain amino acid transport system permease protein